MVIPGLISAGVLEVIIAKSLVASGIPVWISTTAGIIKVTALTPALIYLLSVGLAILVPKPI